MMLGCARPLGFILGFVVLFSSGCVTFRGDYSKSPADFRFGAITQKISVNFSNQTLIVGGKGRARPGKESPIVEGHMLMSSGFFLTTQSIPGEEDLHFRFKTISYESEYGFWNNVPKGLYLAASFLTATVIPFYHRKPRRLKVDVIRQGKVLKSYFYKSYNVLLSWILVAPLWRPSDYGDYWYESTEKTKALDTVLVYEFLEDFHRDFMPKPGRRK